MSDDREVQEYRHDDQWYHFSPSGIVASLRHRLGTSVCDVQYVNLPAELDVWDGAIAVHSPNHERVPRAMFEEGLDREIETAIQERIHILHDGSSYDA